MELKEFVKETLVQIVKGVSDANIVQETLEAVKASGKPLRETEEKTH